MVLLYCSLLQIIQKNEGKILNPFPHKIGNGETAQMFSTVFNYHYLFLRYLINIFHIIIVLMSASNVLYVRKEVNPFLEEICFMRARLVTCKDNHLSMLENWITFSAQEILLYILRQFLVACSYLVSDAVWQKNN